MYTYMFIHVYIHIHTYIKSDFKNNIFTLIPSISIHSHRIHFCFPPFHICTSSSPGSNNLKIFTQYLNDLELLCPHHNKKIISSRKSSKKKKRKKKGFRFVCNPSLLPLSTQDEGKQIVSISYLDSLLPFNIGTIYIQSGSFVSVD